MRYVLCILALLLSCACVHVLAEEVPAADLSDQVPDTESETKINCPAAGASEPGCSGGSSGHTSGPLLTSEPSTLNASLQNGRKEGGEDGIPVPQAMGVAGGLSVQETSHLAGQRETEHQQRAAASTTRPNSADSLTVQGPNHDRGQTQEQTHQGGGNALSPTKEVQPSLHNGKAEEKSQENSEEQHNLQSTGSRNGIPEGHQISRTQVQETSSAGTQDANENKNNADNRSVSSGSTTTNDTAPTQSSSPTSTEANATPSPQETEGNNESGNTNADSGTAPEGSGSSNNQNEGENTDTTTTTTSTTTTTTTSTLPPELTNNKKGDADSSSSISSSVWVRVPLLIVVTLACILVC
ncbi:uncharacterized protein TM35_000531150 [Trypanosoma theileri]|uniref:Mucin TcMUCII n=1 Tax=Trypanosoma theileri TaxID=67003 RepID=A0A1X0NH67_9TRYP|nr:uncharacterized protein TM35_000531150 [Trypanosoma theileri]ORC83931.1 hypothetical protein TM35_000531150 [Trypanosoma theileri]